MELERSLIDVDGVLIDAVVGHRVWALSAEEGEAYLRSMTTALFWPKGSPVVAECCRGAGLSQHFLTEHPKEGMCLGAECTCGIHAYRDAPRPMAWARETRMSILAYGQVYLWGAVKVHQFGFRAQFAKVAGLYLPPPRDRHTIQLRDDPRRLRVELAALQYEVPLLMLPGLVSHTIEKATP